MMMIFSERVTTAIMHDALLLDDGYLIDRSFSLSHIIFDVSKETPWYLTLFLLPNVSLILKFLVSLTHSVSWHDRKDVRLPIQLQRAMAAEAEAAREARAKVIAAEGEHKSARALKEASQIIMDSPAALQLRYLQTLQSIAAEKNSTIIFPVPVELIGAFAGSCGSPLPPRIWGLHIFFDISYRYMLQIKTDLPETVTVLVYYTMLLPSLQGSDKSLKTSLFQR